MALAAFFSLGVLYKRGLPMVAQGRLSFLYETPLNLCTFPVFVWPLLFCFPNLHHKKGKIQGVPCCKNQSQYHISCHATSQVMFVCLLFECATFTHKPWVVPTLPYQCSPFSPRFIVSDAMSSPGPLILPTSIYRHLRRFHCCHIICLCLCAMLQCMRGTK